ncbi:amidohydrolase family protein [Pontibacter sp. G13]|uniref:metal-dependent hydrolase family protein n=1 Tax=Pontibacter sp. G13 TaxID=3074898 RepID=UPI00288C3AF0|nr:amidohydrolase family protein [Pontibacter sp. G13]WNJ17866.1 amidohydrolase family protein [Pontibacter sp. G13]
MNALRFMLVGMITLMTFFPILAQNPVTTTLIINADIFDGQHESLKKGQSVLIEGNIIKEIAPQINVSEGARIINAKGATLSPGFIGAHEHVMFQVSPADFLTADTRYFAYVATVTAETYLMNGWTSIRDASGNSFSLKRAIDEDIIPGPRIFPSGGMLSQTAGHADIRIPSNLGSFAGGPPSHAQLFGDLVVADGPDEVMKAAREQMRLGATQIKIAVGGSSLSPGDPLDVIEFTEGEIQAAVKAAEDYQTYVMAHVYTPVGIKRSIENGVKCIEHACFADRETISLMQEKGVWLSVQILGFQPSKAEGLTQAQIDQWNETTAGIDGMLKLTKELNFDKIGFGTDVVYAPDLIKTINKEFTLRTQWFSTFEIMKQATCNSGQIINLSNRMIPGKLGVIEEGALADILLINGNPMEDLNLLLHPEENLLMIMKDGKIYKNILK